MKKSLQDRIRQAKDKAELAALLEEGAGYQYASQKTKNRWAKACRIRIAELNNPR